MYCTCGTKIDIDSRWNGLIHRVVFKHEGVEIDRCPGCGESTTAWLKVSGEQLVYCDGALLEYPPDQEAHNKRIDVEEVKQLLREWIATLSEHDGEEWCSSYRNMATWIILPEEFPEFEQGYETFFDWLDRQQVMESKTTLNEEALEQVIREISGYRADLSPQQIRATIEGWLEEPYEPKAETSQDIIWGYQRSLKGD